MNFNKLGWRILIASYLVFILELHEISVILASLGIMCLLIHFFEYYVFPYKNIHGVVKAFLNGTPSLILAIVANLSGSISAGFLLLPYLFGKISIILALVMSVIVFIISDIVIRRLRKLLNVGCPECGGWLRAESGEYPGVQANGHLLEGRIFSDTRKLCRWYGCGYKTYWH